MTTAITTKLKTHYAVLKDGRTIPVTTAQKDKILTDKRLEKLKSTDFVQLDGYTGECGSIKEFVPIPQSNTAGK